MIKKLLLNILVFVICLIFLTSCIKNSEQQDKIKLCYYTSSANINYHLKFTIDKVKKFCEESNIPLEILEYNSDTLDVNDYILKRNILASSGNMIIIDSNINLSTLAKQSTDYSKISNYNNILNAFKGRYFIPLYTQYIAKTINNEVMNHYEIYPSKSVITYTEYLEIKQRMKEKGARFELNSTEIFEIINCYLNINKILLIGETEIVKNNVEFKNALKNTVLNVCNDILIYYDKSLESENNLNSIIDRNTSLTFVNSIFEENYIHGIISPRYITQSIKDVSDKTVYIDPFNSNVSTMTNLFIHKKISNERIYEVANYILSEDFFSPIEVSGNTISKSKASVYILPLNLNDRLREFYQINSNLQYTAGGNKDALKIANDTFDAIFNDDKKSKDIADYLYFNYDNYHEVKMFIYQLVFDAAKKISNSTSLENFNPSDKELNKFIDEKIEEFVKNYDLHNN